MHDTYTIDELFDACIVLFGSEIQLSPDFLHYLKPEGVKAAYRKKALSTHPDRSLVTGSNAKKMREDFIRVNTAYQKLILLVQGKGKVSQVNGTNAKANDAASPEKKSRCTGNGFWKTGILPKRRLPICQFLYFTGNIPWKTYIEALVWQRRQRPTVGKIALSLGLLSKEQIRLILAHRRRGEKFGECALRMDLLSAFHLGMVIKKQQRLQLPVGEYFIRSGILTRLQVEKMVQQQASYNQGMNSA